MGRPERRIDPEAGPVPAFAAELRALRERAGRPKYAALAQRTGKSQTALAEAAGGQRLPTWETVAAYVTGCRGDLDHWRRRWHEVAAQVNPVQATAGSGEHGLPDAEGGPQPAESAGLVGSTPGGGTGEAVQRGGAGLDSNGTGPDSNGTDPDNSGTGPDNNGTDPDNDRTDPNGGGTGTERGGTDPKGDRTEVGRQRSGRRVVLLAAVGALTALAAAALAVPALTRPGGGGDDAAPLGTATAPPALDGEAGIAVADEADPKDSGCAADPDVLSVDNVELVWDQRPVGLLELRYSPRCGVAWPRFLPLGAGPPAGQTTVHVDVVRPADQSRATFAMPYAGTSVFGNVLRSTRHCVIAEARLTLPPGSAATPSARTACYRGRVRDTTTAP